MLSATLFDEIAYLPIERLGANLFFQLISRRYEKGPMILTSNQSFSAWGEVFGNRVIATAILDRLLHHAITPNIYRSTKALWNLNNVAELKIAASLTMRRGLTKSVVSASPDRSRVVRFGAPRRARLLTMS